MTDNGLHRFARVRDEDLAGTHSGPAGAALFAAITAGDLVPSAPEAREVAVRTRRGATVPWRRTTAVPQGAVAAAKGDPRRGFTRRFAVAAAVVTAVTGGAVLGPSLVEDGTGPATSYADSAIEISRENGYFVARIKDPLADRQRYAEGFRAVGKNVEIVLVPVPPAMVGDLVETRGRGGRVSSDLEPLDGKPVDCRLAPSACVLVIRVPVSGDASVTYTFGRAAGPGEPVSVPDDGSGAGEPSEHRTTGG
jgi:hypothetical protein